MKQPVLKLGLVCGLSLETTSHDGGVHDPTEPQEPPETCSRSNPLPRSTYHPSKEQYGPEVNDGRRRKRVASLRRTVSDGHVGEEGYNDEL